MTLEKWARAASSMPAPMASAASGMYRASSARIGSSSSGWASPNRAWTRRTRSMGTPWSSANWPIVVSGR
jgi:hypothetical protein